MKLKQITLHTSLYFAGVTWGDKLPNPTKPSGMTMEYDGKASAILIRYKGETGLIPFSNVGVMVIDENK